jgi:hypothetical protein
MFQDVSLQNLEKFLISGRSLFQISKFGWVKIIGNSKFSGAPLISHRHRLTRRTGRPHARVRHHGRWSYAVGDRRPHVHHVCCRPFPLLHRSRSHLSNPTPISARLASALLSASLCLPWPPPTHQTTTLECPSNRTAGFTSPGSHDAHRPGRQPPWPPA